ncbi:hypothetical protein [Caballeronia sp. dw_19]|uniref:hypothetical protein n=1 Tax=Caballeronia sp. dw_19 TaxID=2719791 RepID=UPI001BCD7725|nr:hypothetical protein [Caballeronia sp. dw_19]
MSDDLIRNTPSPEGRLLGTVLARLHDAAAPAVLAEFPDHAERCASCAFRAGSFPNGCVITTMDALKATVEGTPFYCHHDCAEDGSPTALCAGWAIAVTSIDEAAGKQLSPLTANWEFSK